MPSMMTTIGQISKATVIIDGPNDGKSAEFNRVFKKESVYIARKNSMFDM